MVRSDRNDCPNVNLLLLHSLAADSQFAYCARNGSELGDGWSPAGLIKLLSKWCDEAGMSVEFNQFMKDRRECMGFAFGSNSGILLFLRVTLLPDHLPTLVCYLICF